MSVLFLEGSNETSFGIGSRQPMLWARYPLGHLRGRPQEVNNTWCEEQLQHLAEVSEDPLPPAECRSCKVAVRVSYLQTSPPETRSLSCVHGVATKHAYFFLKTAAG